MIFAYSYISAYWHLALRPSRTRLKNWHANSFFHCFTMFFLRKGRRAQRAENFDAISYTPKKYIRLLWSELETKSYTLKKIYSNYSNSPLFHSSANFLLPIWIPNIWFCYISIEPPINLSFAGFSRASCRNDSAWRNLPFFLGARWSGRAGASVLKKII